MARPDLRAFPTSPAVQPLPASTRRELLESVPFVQGYGVEIGLLVDLVARFGTDAMAQADLGEREHRNRPLDELPRRAAVPSPACAAPALERHLGSSLVRYDEDHESLPCRSRCACESVPDAQRPCGLAKFAQLSVERGTPRFERLLAEPPRARIARGVPDAVDERAGIRRRQLVRACPPSARR
jgi:hypothetical protein